MTRRLVSMAMAAGVLARLLVLAGAWVRRGRAAFLVPDSWTYLAPADSFVRGAGFLDLHGLPELFRTPAYPLLLAGGAAFEHPLRFALAAQVAMSAGIVALTFLLARRVLHDERLAVICAFAVALEPTLMAWSLKIMPETFLTLSLVAFAYAAVRAIDEPQPRWIVTAAAALCLAAYVKPIAYPLAIFFCLVLLMRWRTAAIFIPACVLLLAPWHVRNARFGHAGFSTLFARAAYISAGGSIVAARERRPFEDVRRDLVARVDARAPASYGREGVALIASHPMAYAKTHVKGMLRTMFDPGAAEYLRFFDLYREGGQAKLASGGLTATARAYPLAFWSSIALAAVLAPLVLLPLVAAGIGRIGPIGPISPMRPICPISLTSTSSRTSRSCPRGTGTCSR